MHIKTKFRLSVECLSGVEIVENWWLNHIPAEDKACCRAPVSLVGPPDPRETEPQTGQQGFSAMPATCHSPGTQNLGMASKRAYKIQALGLARCPPALLAPSRASPQAALRPEGPGPPSCGGSAGTGLHRDRQPLIFVRRTPLTPPAGRKSSKKPETIALARRVV